MCRERRRQDREEERLRVEEEMMGEKTEYTKKVEELEREKKRKTVPLVTERSLYGCITVFVYFDRSHNPRHKHYHSCAD